MSQMTCDAPGNKVAPGATSASFRSLLHEHSLPGDASVLSAVHILPQVPAQSYAIAAPHELQPVKTTRVSHALQLQLAIDSSLFTTLTQQ